jgi:hypothetical protein
MGPGAEGHDFDRHAMRHHVDQMTQLLSHNCRTPDPAVERLLVYDEGYMRGLRLPGLVLLPFLLPEEFLLPFHPQPHEAPGCAVIAVDPKEFERILLGVQQAWDKVRMEHADRGRRAFVAKKLGELGCNDVAISAPPGAAFASARRLGKTLHHSFVGHFIELKQCSQIGHRYPHGSRFNPD